MKNHQKQHYHEYHIMLSDGSSIKTSRSKCFAKAEPKTTVNPYPQRWYYSPDGQMAIRLPRNEIGEQYGKANAADLKGEERIPERNKLCIGQTSHASCTVTCHECRFSEYCNSKYRVKNGDGCKRKCECCTLYVRRTLELDKPRGFNDDGTAYYYDLADETVDVEAAYIVNEHREAIAAVIANLDSVDRELWSCLVNKIKKVEIAKKLNMSVDGVYFRQKKLERLLRENEAIKNILKNF